MRDSEQLNFSEIGKSRRTWRKLYHTYESPAAAGVNHALSTWVEEFEPKNWYGDTVAQSGVNIRT